MKKKLFFTIVLLVLLILSVVVFSHISKKNGGIFNRNYTFKEYKVGDSIRLNNEEWYVIKNSSKKDNYVTLISSSFYYNEDNSYVLEEIYETSKLRKYLENDFVKEHLDGIELVEKSGYKIRLLELDDFNNLVNYSYDKKEDIYKLEDCSFYLCLTGSRFATMIDTESDTKKDEYSSVSDIKNLFDDYKLHLRYYNVNSIEEDIILESVTSDAIMFIRPVINVNKDSIEE